MVQDYVRADSGVYTVVLENERGRDRIKLNVIVIGKIPLLFASELMTPIISLFFFFSVMIQLYEVEEDSRPLRGSTCW